MKRLLFTILVTAFLIPLFAFACDQESFFPCEKTYVTTSQLAFSDEAIFVHLNGNWFKTNALQADNGGLFIQQLSDSAFGCPNGQISCRWCGKCVSQNYDWCPNCSRPVR